MESNELISLVQKSKDGDMEAMEQLLRYAHTSVSYQCRKMLQHPQDAEDLTQEVLVTVFQKLETLKEPAAFNKWLHRITAGKCINAITRSHGELQFAEDEEGHSVLDALEETDEQKVPEKWLDNRETARMIDEIVNGLPEAQRMCTLMFYYSELSVKEMSEVMKVSENTVKSRLNYARKAIREKVLGYEKQGIKLYGLSPLPFLYYFLHLCKDDGEDGVAAQLMVDRVLSGSAAAVGIAGSTAATAGVVGSSATGISSAGTGFLAALGLTPIRIAASVAAAFLLAGGTAAVVTHVTTSVPAPTSLMEEQDAPVHNDIQDPPAIVSPATVSAETGSDAATDPTDATIPQTVPEESMGSPVDTGAAAPAEKQTEAVSQGCYYHQCETVSRPNCTQGGTRVTKCIYCGALFYTDVGPSSHSYVHKATVAPTETNDGYIEYACSVCGAVDRREYHEHSWAKSIHYPTCTQQGYATRRCSKCQLKEVLYFIDPKGHKWDAWVTVTSPSAEAEGSAKRTCSACGETETRTLPRLAADHVHSYTAAVTAQPTCNKYGTTTYTCQCGDVYTENIPFSAEHDYFSTEVPPNCIGIGYTLYTCYRCNTSYRENIVPKKGHSYVDTVVPPTETEQGYTLHICSVCSESYRDHYTDPIPPSETTAG